jgi:hypothetical protein
MPQTLSAAKYGNGTFSAQKERNNEKTVAAGFDNLPETAIVSGLFVETNFFEENSYDHAFQFEKRRENGN